MAVTYWTMGLPNRGGLLAEPAPHTPSHSLRPSQFGYFLNVKPTPVARPM
jgi:hypothetical protein